MGDGANQLVELHGAPAICVDGKEEGPRGHGLEELLAARMEAVCVDGEEGSGRVVWAQNRGAPGDGHGRVHARRSTGGGFWEEEWLRGRGRRGLRFVQHRRSGEEIGRDRDG